MREYFLNSDFGVGLYNGNRFHDAKESLKPNEFTWWSHCSELRFYSLGQSQNKKDMKSIIKFLKNIELF